MIPADGSKTNDALAVLQVHIDDLATGNELESGVKNSTLKMTIDGTPYTPIGQGGTNPDARLVWDSAAGTLTWTPTSDWTEASHSVTAYVEDNAGNSTSLAWSFTADYTAPTFAVAFFRHYSGGAFSEQARNDLSSRPNIRDGLWYIQFTAVEAIQAPPTFTLTAADGTVLAEAAATRLVSGNVYVGQIEIDTDTKTDGIAAVTVSGVGMAGNWATDSTPTTGAAPVIDRVGIAVSLEYLIGGQTIEREFIGSGASLTIRATFAQNIFNDGTTKPRIRIFYYPTGQWQVPNKDATANLVAPVDMVKEDDNTWTYTFTVTPATGTSSQTILDYQVEIKNGQDLAGNENLDATEAVMGVILVGPAVTGIEVRPNPASAVTGYDKVWIGFRTSHRANPASTAVQLRDVAGVGVHRSATMEGGPQQRGTVWQFSYSIAGDETEQACVIRITAVDFAGKTVTKDTEVVIDLTPPSLSVTPGEGSTPAEGETVEWLWSDPGGEPENAIDLSKVSVLFDGEDVTEKCILRTDGGSYQI